MKRFSSVAVVFFLLLPGAPLKAGGPIFGTSLERLNRSISGQIVDYTHNHGEDRRIWSAALCQKRDLYVYLPPCFDPQKHYPVMIWLHGFAQDEQSFPKYLLRPLDRAIIRGDLPPMIVVVPDGSLTGEGSIRTAGTFFLNTKAGAYEDFIIQDVWGFVKANYPIRPEREAHILAGVSMGGGAAYNLGMKYRDQFKIVLGIFPPVNLRWVDCHCRYFGNFRPDCWGWRTNFSRSHEAIARFYLVFKIRLMDVIGALYDIGPETASQVSFENPIEMIDRLHLQEGELSMFIGYSRFDEFNIDAQVESFLYLAHERGLTVDTAYSPRGHHNVRTAMELFPESVAWLSRQLAPVSECPAK